MFVLFMGGSMFTISGTKGGDLVKVVSYLISEDNLGPSKDTIILGKVKKYLNQCFNHEGNILKELGLSEANVKLYEDLKEAKLNFEELRNQFKDMLFKFVYSEYNEELTQRLNYESLDLQLVAEDGSDPISFVDLLNKYNEYSKENTKNEIWNITIKTDNHCSNEGTSPTSETIYNPKNCFPTVWAYPLIDVNEKLELIIKTLINKVGDTSDTVNSIIKIIENSEIDALSTYIDKINEITKIVDKYISEDGELFSFMNCAFIKDNMQVILFYLKNSFENDMFEVGVYLLIAAFQCHSEYLSLYF